MGNIIDRTVRLIEDRLNFSTLNHELIAANLANMDTPRYVAKRLTFEDSLREALEDNKIPLKRTSIHHLEPNDPLEELRHPKVVETGPVDLETEMGRLAQNSVEYLYMITLLNKKLSILRQVIDEGGK